MNINIKKDFIVSVFFAFLALCYLYFAQKISVFNPFADTGPNSQTVPKIIGWLMLFLSLSLFTSTLFKCKEIKKETKEDENIEELEIKNQSPIKLIISLVFLTFYVGTYQYLGFILSSIIYLILQSLLLMPSEKHKKWVVFIIGLSILFTVITYFIFSKYLTMSLPIGILG